MASQLLDYLRRSRARYLIVGEGTLAQLTGWRGEPVDGLRLLHREGDAEQGAAVFEILPVGADLGW